MKKIILLLFLAFICTETYSQCEPAIRYEDTGLTAFFADTSGFQWASYQWEFFDGSPSSTVSHPNHTFPDTGLYVVCFTGVTPNGCVGTQCINVGIGVPALNHRLDIPVYYDCSPPLPLTFTVGSSSDGLGHNPTLNFHITFGDGTDTTFTGTTGHLEIAHTYTNAGTYIINSTITDSIGTTASYTSQPIIVASICGPVSGAVYHDMNSNCIYDAGEEVAGVPLYIFNGTQLLGSAMSDSLGQYSFEVPTGISYDISVYASNGISSHYTPGCPVSGMLTVNVPSSGNNFGLTCPHSYDLTGSVTSSLPRPGFITEVCITVYNRWCNTPNGQILVVFDPDVTPFPDSSGIGYAVNGNTVSLPIQSNEYYWSFCVRALVSVNAQLGDSVCYDLDIQPAIGDSIPGNNVGQYCFMVRNSFDPNDKAVSPAGEGLQGFIRPDTDLTYTIRFQNTGTADAVNIYILDTLSANLDASSVEVIGTSHNMIWLLLTGNIVRFTYNNIHLPDSNTNEPASHGYVTYRIKQADNIAHMATINNTAAIYFDFNQPIITNTTVNTIDFFLDANELKKDFTITAYPNPADDFCKITFNNAANRIISVTDLIGKKIIFHELNSNSYSLDVRKFSEGVYLMNILDSTSDTKTVKLVVQH